MKKLVLIVGVCFLVGLLFNLGCEKKPEEEKTGEGLTKQVEKTTEEAQKTVEEAQKTAEEVKKKAEENK